MARKPHPDSARAAIDAVLEAADRPLRLRTVLAALAGTRHKASTIAVALHEGVDRGRYMREGAGKPYSYRLATTDEASPTVGPVPAAAYAGPAFDQLPTGAHLGLVCGDELPPVIGARYRDTVHAICRRAVGALDG